MKLISVIIPVYNRFGSLKETINSVCKQTYRHIEIIVVDDGSEEDIESGLKAFRDDRIVYYRLVHTNGNNARNYGIKQSKGNYIAMLDSDDLWLPTHLAECLSILEGTGADGLYGSLILRESDTKKESVILARSPRKNESVIDYLLQTGYGAQTSTLFTTKESAQAVLWDISLQAHQDYDFVTRYCKKYKMTPKITPTVIYNKKGKAKHIDFLSCIEFIRKNKDGINPVLYNDYNLKMLTLANNQQAAQPIITHYRDEATYYKEYLSYFEYTLIKRARSTTERLKNKLGFIYYILKHA